MAVGAFPAAPRSCETRYAGNRRQPDRPPLRPRASRAPARSRRQAQALATTGAKRPETIPDLPTVAESGLPGYEAVGWFGLLAPAATPKSTVEKLSTDANRVLADQEIRTRMQAVGADPSGNTPEEFARFIRDDQAK